ncbi:hypothetical protein ACS77F_07270 [Yersinia enterocolitica]|uniref:hypothetical protein n=1 Tax=Yersinia enterocolitica TaxID=630 RepID=UPI002AC4E8AE|nr:hypothetical protein [Yersinia enterocolitica]HEN3319738.1 hypothetical protein [Yersinia enterocolitica]
MLLAYAVEKDTAKIVHIDEVPNGIKCNCICKECNDELIAKNRGKIQQHHFAHKNMTESRSCLMTQLHLAAQYYFLSLKKFLIPEVEFQYKDKNFKIPSSAATILSAQMEVQIDKYIADILIDTNVGKFIIEICVTHKCEEEKINFYKENKVNTLEYIFNNYDHFDTEEWLDRLATDVIPVEWIYYQCKEDLIIKHDNELIFEAELKKQRRIKNTESTILKQIKTKELLLPEIKKPVSYIYDNDEHFKDLILLEQKTIIIDSVEFIKKEEDIYILEGVYEYKHKKYNIWIVYSISNKKPDISSFSDANIIIRSYPEDKDTPLWEWLRYPPLEKKERLKYEEFVEECKKKADSKQELLNIYLQLNTLAENHFQSRDSLFKKDFWKWRTWMTHKNLFTPAENGKGPSIPNILKTTTYSYLWMFNSWHVFFVSRLIEKIDNIPVGVSISFSKLFDLISYDFPPIKEFYFLENMAKNREIQIYHKPFIERKAILHEVLKPFLSFGAITIADDDIKRISSLIELLNE